MLLDSPTHDAALRADASGFPRPHGFRSAARRGRATRRPFAEVLDGRTSRTTEVVATLRRPQKDQ